MSTITTKPQEESSGIESAVVPFLQSYGYYLAFMVALVAMSGSLFYSEVMKFLPCPLCWYQRILMYPLVILTLVGIFRRDEGLPAYILPFTLIGIAVSSYHYMLQMGVITQEACSGIACSTIYVLYGGFITIPFMALTAFTLITIIMFAMRWANSFEVVEA